ncbi:hypothetical protein AB8B22_07360 [Leptotrichia sp. HSP-334]|uniref:Uncharacterized protein n=1 Tax=Leptotrichia rugosa TaxID=3239302 RepID=A0AB39VG42_9FUSO
MKKLILFLIIFTSFIIFPEQKDKNSEIYEKRKYSTVLKIENDDYDRAVGIRTSNRRDLKGVMTVIMGGSFSVDNDVASIYNQISKNANKVTLIYFDDKDTPAIKRVIDTLKKKKFSGKVEVISFLNKESKILKNSFAKKDWSYTNYYNLDDISELVSYDGEKKTKSEVIKIFLEKIKKSLENNEDDINKFYETN